MTQNKQIREGRKNPRDQDQNIIIQSRWGNTTLALIKHDKLDENEPRGQKSQRKRSPLWSKLIKALITRSLVSKNKEDTVCD